MIKIWEELENMGYLENDCITYFDFQEACSNAGFDVDDIDIDTFETTFSVYIG